MKTWIIFILFSIITTLVVSNNTMEIPEHMKKHAKKLHKYCQSQTDTAEDVIRESLKGVLPKNKNFECYIQCLFDVMGIMDESNFIHMENLIQILPEEMHAIIRNLSQACDTQEGDDKCNIAYNTLQCYIDNNPIMIKDNFQFLFD